MIERDVADLLCISERKVRDLREEYLEETKHYTRGDKGEVAYTVNGLAALAGCLGIDVTELGGAEADSAQDGPEMAGTYEDTGVASTGHVAGQPEREVGGNAASPALFETAAAAVKDEPAEEKQPMVRVKILRRLPNARQYVVRVCETRRVVRMLTRTRMGLKPDRVLWCLDYGEHVVFDRRASRLRVHVEKPA